MEPRPWYRQRLKVAAVVGLAAVIVVGILIFGSARDAIGKWLAGECFLVQSQDRIEWVERPRLVGDSLVMSGKARDGARIHDARTEFGDTYWAAFSLNEAASEGRQLEVVASLWPQDLAASVGVHGGNHIFAEPDRYVVSSTGFRVRFALPPEIRDELYSDAEVGVSVWGENPGAASMPLGAACIRSD